MVLWNIGNVLISHVEEIFSSNYFNRGLFCFSFDLLIIFDLFKKSTDVRFLLYKQLLNFIQEIQFCWSDLFEIHCLFRVWFLFGFCCFALINFFMFLMFIFTFTFLAFNYSKILKYLNKFINKYCILKLRFCKNIHQTSNFKFRKII